MSLYNTRRRLRHRCTVQRDANRGTASDDWGGDAIPSWQAHLTDQPCYYWTSRSRSGGTVMDDDKVVEISTRLIAFPLGADVTEDDRISSLTDRLGTTVVDGPMRVDEMLVYPDHQVARVTMLR